MTFAEADAHYEVVKQQYLSGALNDDQFEAQLHRLMVLDDAGLWWAKSRENGAWHYYNATTGAWIAATPPAPAPSPPPPPPPIMPPASSTGSAPAPAGSHALPATSQGAPATAGYDARDFGPIPELTASMKVLFYVLSLLLPLVGLVLYFVYRSKPTQADQSAARAFLILGIASIVFSCMCSTTYFLLEATMLGTGT